jgi:hypothetical protein
MFHSKYKFGMKKSKIRLNIQKAMSDLQVQCLIVKLIGPLKLGKATGAGWQAILVLEVPVAFYWLRVQE